MRTCRRCKEAKENSEFHKHTREKDGLSRECKTCKSKADKDYNRRHEDEIKAKKKIYRTKNKEKIRESQKRSVEKNKDYYERKQKEYTAEHREESRLRANEYYYTNKDGVLEKQRTIRAENPQIHMLHAAKKRAKNSGFDFDLCVEELVVPLICPIIGIELATGSLKKEKQSPSLDRLDNAKGYTKDNAWVVSSLANTMKSDASFEELVLFARWIVGDSSFSAENQEVEQRVLRRWHSGIKSRCKREGVVFEISYEDLHIPKICPVFGKVLSKKHPAGSKMLPSVDKIDPALGYIRNNIQIISRQANTMKNKATKLELFSFAGWVFKTFATDYLTQGSERAKLVHSLLQEQKLDEAQKYA